MRIGFWGNFGTHNLGNECTLAAILHNIRLRVPQAQLVAICVDPQDAAARHRVEAVPMWRGASPARTCMPGFVRRVLRPVAEWRRTLALCRGLDALMVPGTGVLSDTYEGPFGFPYNLFRWAVATRLNGGRVFIVSIGVETIAHPLSRFFIRCALGLAQRRSFRDPRAIDLIRAAGFRGRCEIYPDLAFSLPEPAPRASAREAPPTVAIGLFNFRDASHYGGGPGGYGRYVDHMSSLVLWLVGRGHPVRVLIGDVTLDMDVLADLRARLQERGFDLAHPAYADEPATSYQQVMEQIAAASLVIASRFHNIVLALLLRRPVLALSYEGKIEALMRDMGLSQYCQRYQDFDLERMLGQFAQMEREAAALCRTIAQRVQAHRAELDQQYELLLGDLRMSATPRS